MTDRTHKVANLIRELSASFISRIDNHTSLITITHAKVSNDLKRATIFMTVIPEDKEKNALEFLKRNRSEIRDYIKKNMNSKVIPFLEIEIDKGEKHRQKIDELLR